MSAGTSSGPTPNRDLAALAPKFRAAVEASLAECHAEGLDAFVFEAHRSDALAQIYYARGRTVKPPHAPVTNAKSALYTWHGYGLAVDVISRAMLWDAPEEWWHRVAKIFERHGCTWGGRWRQRDLPHHQWGRCKPSPSDRARSLYATGGMQAVWEEVGAA